MNRFLTLAILFPILLASCSPSSDNASSSSSELVASLRARKYSIDSLINEERKLIALAKVKGRESLVDMPKAAGQRIEAVFNVYKNDGRIIYIAEMPKSPEDEWFIAYKSYFDEQGKLFAFQRQNNFFHSDCTDGAALENLVKYYNQEFESVDSTYSLTDSRKKELETADCKFPYNFPYKINKDVEEYQQQVKGL